MLVKPVIASRMVFVNIEMLKKIFRMLVLVAVATASAAEWGTNYEAALSQARAEGKVVLANFTGSDWCGYCMQLRKNVLDEMNFAAWAGEHFVLLEVDVPNNPQFSREQLAQNQMLCTKYAIDGFPTLLVLDSVGRPLGGLFGYVADPAAVRHVLEKGVRANTLLMAADSLEGEARLEAMLQAWSLIPEDLYELNLGLQAEIAAIDKQDRSGLKAAADAERRFQACKHAADAAPTDAVALDIVNAALFEAVPQNRRQLLELKYKLMICSVETPEDVYAAAEIGYQMIDADLRLSPKVKESRKKQLRGVFANPQTSINRSRIIHRKRPIR